VNGPSTPEFNPLSSEFFDDPYAIYTWMRDEAPVYYSERWGFYALSRHEDVIAAHRDWETYSSAYGVTLDMLRLGQRFESNIMILMDPPEHERLRKLVRQVFTRKAVDDLEPLVLKVMTGILDPLMGSTSLDLVADFAAPFPVEVISAMLGIPEGERQQIRLWTDEFLHRDEGNPKATARGIEASASLYNYMLEQAKAKRSSSDGLIMSRLLQATLVDDDGVEQRLTDEDVAAFVMLLASAGSETVTKLVGNGVVDFADNPDQWKRVVADPALVPGAVEEMLRLHPPSQYQGRFTTRDVELEGGTIPAGSPTLLVTGAATRDPRSYRDPDVFDIDRQGHTTIAFGYGAHSCLGAWLARLEARVAFEQIRERWPGYTVDRAGLRRVSMSNVAGYSNVPVGIA
jgi:cytochrome P450